MNCPKSGIKIHKSDNDYNKDPFLKDSKLTKPVSFQNTTLNSLDLDLDNYSLEDLYHLFNISNGHLSEESLKSAKQIVLKMHPDKSRLEPKYFLFFSRAYKRLYSIYDFQNKSDNKKYNDKADRSYSNNDNYFDIVCLKKIKSLRIRKISTLGLIKHLKNTGLIILQNKVMVIGLNQMMGFLILMKMSQKEI